MSSTVPLPFLMSISTFRTSMMSIARTGRPSPRPIRGARGGFELHAADAREVVALRN